MPVPFFICYTVTIMTLYDFESAREGFLAWLLLERGLSENTASAYSRDLQRWFDFCTVSGVSPFPPEETGIARFQRFLVNNGGSKSSRQRTMAGLRTWMRFLQVEEVLVSDVALPELPQKERRLPQILGEGEIDRLLEVCAGEDPLSRRDRALFEVAYGCGLRASELCSLRTGDVDFASKTLRALGKSEKERTVPFLGEPAHRVRIYLETARPMLAKAETDALFLSRNGMMLNREDVWRILQKRGAEAGISRKRLHPHILRHSFATHLLRRGMDQKTLQEILGHASISTTDKYLHFDLELRDVYDASHPRA